MPVRRSGVVVAFNFGLAGAADGPVVGEGVGAAVEAGVYHMHAFAPVDLDLLGFALVHHVRGFGISGKRHLAAGDGNGLLVGLALIGELVHLYAGEVLPAVRQRPGGGAALGVPVVELLLGILDQLAGEGIPHPRQQVGLVASGAAIACGDHTGCDLHAVEGDGALAVGCARGVVGTTGDYYNVAVGILQGNLLVAVVRVRVGHGSGIAIVGGQQRVVDPAVTLKCWMNLVDTSWVYRFLM